MGKSEDFTGRKFGRLTALRMSGHNESGIRLWLWRCDCGKEIDRPSAPIKAGHQISCGCHRDEQSRSRAKHGKWQTRTYRAWIAMKARCRGRDKSDQKHYVDRGITVCDRWKDSFVNFAADMGECPEGKTLERVKNDLGYGPDNCIWATQAQQVRNTRRTVRVAVAWADPFGVVTERELCLKDACTIIGVNYDRVRSRIRKGMTPEAALDQG